MKFLNYDSSLMASLRRLVDYLCLGLLWIAASVPIITFGAATVAMLRTAEISVRQEGKIFLPFWKYFAAEFKQATVLWLIELPILAVLACDCLLIMNSELPLLFRAPLFAAAAIIFCWIQLWFGYQSKFQDSLKIVLKNTFLMAFGNVGISFLMCALTVVAWIAGFAVLLSVTPMIFAVPGIYIMAYTTLLRNLLRKYIPHEVVPARESAEE